MKCTFLPAELKRGAEELQCDFDCGCDQCAILHFGLAMIRVRAGAELTATGNHLHRLGPMEVAKLTQLHVVTSEVQR